MKTKTPVQIDKGLKDLYIRYCKKNGYSLSGRVEYWIREELSGSLKIK